MKTVKLLGTPRFEIEIAELSNGKYVVVYASLGEAHTSEQLDDYHTAAAVFDFHLSALEGN